MIYILDNGGEYSGHEILFVESDHHDVEAVGALLVAHGDIRCRTRHTLLGVAMEVSWRESGGSDPLQRRVRVRDFFTSESILDQDDPEPIRVITPRPAVHTPARPDLVEVLRRPLFEETPLLLLAHLLDRWPVTPEDAPHRKALCRAIDERESRTEKSG